MSRRIADAVAGSFGMDTITLAGPLRAKLGAMAGAGFGQVMLKADDLVGHPDGWRAAVAEVRASGLRPTGFQVLRDFEGLSDELHAYKVDVAKQMLQMCAAVGGKVLLACSSTSAHASADQQQIVRDLRKLAMLALPLGIRIAYEALSWARHVNEYTVAWEIVEQADCPNLGLCIDSYHILAAGTSLAHLERIDASRIFLVQLSDFMWQQTANFEDRKATARSFRVFPGEGAHTAQLAQLVRALGATGYQGDMSFEVFNDDYLQMPLETVAARARRSAAWLTEEVLQSPAALAVVMR